MKTGTIHYSDTDQPVRVGDLMYVVHDDGDLIAERVIREGYLADGSNILLTENCWYHSSTKCRAFATPNEAAQAALEILEAAQ